MGQIKDLSQGNLSEIWRRIRALEFATNQNSMAIGRGGLSVYGGGGITIENGGLSVTGSATVVGVLNADGTINMTGLFIASGEMRLNGTTIATGDFNIDGPLLVDGNTTFNGELTINGETHTVGDVTVSGDLTVNGPMKTTGSLDVEGVTTLKANLNVTTGGKIKAGVTEIHPGGNISFGPDLQITPDNGSGSAAIQNGASEIVLTPDNPDYWVQFSGGAYFQGLVRAAALRVTSLPTSPQPANLYVDSAGKFYRSTAA